MDKQSLLVISENPTVSIWLKKHLNAQFFVIETDSKEKALGLIHDTPFDFIILDGAIEECDPLDLSRELRALTPVPILLITNRLKKEYRQTAFKAGVTSFLSEELDDEELKIRIENGRKATETQRKTSNLSSRLNKPPKEDA
ncbi:MAG: response regulator [Verrucomicrobiota bacterium]|nr:response regulator [Verrucomicrobiota bacterium]